MYNILVGMHNQVPTVPAMAAIVHTGHRFGAAIVTRRALMGGKANGAAERAFQNK
jgi:hypothetical protein